VRENQLPARIPAQAAPVTMWLAQSNVAKGVFAPKLPLDKKRASG
jgi:hypothetical protein